MWLLQWRLQYIASPTSQGTSFEYRIYKTYKNPALKKLFIFRERRREGKRETSMCGCLLHTPNWGPGLQLRHVPQLGLNWQPLGFQADIQSMEPQQPGPQPLLFLFELINPLLAWEPWAFHPLILMKACAPGPAMCSTLPPHMAPQVGLCTSSGISK